MREKRVLARALKSKRKLRGGGGSLAFVKDIKLQFGKNAIHCYFVELLERLELRLNLPLKGQNCSPLFSSMYSFH